MTAFAFGGQRSFSNEQGLIFPIFLLNVYFVYSVVFSNGQDFILARLGRICRW